MAAPLHAHPTTVAPPILLGDGRPSIHPSMVPRHGASSPVPTPMGGSRGANLEKNLGLFGLQSSSFGRSTDQMNEGGKAKCSQNQGSNPRIFKVFAMAEDSNTAASLPPLREDDDEQASEEASGLSAASGSSESIALGSRSRYAPLPWHDLFDAEADVRIEGSGNSFHVYMAGTEGPVVFCLHGGGSSGLSFALAAKLLKDNVRVVAMDMRGHGLTHTDNDLDLSCDTLCSDVLDVIKTMYREDTPAIILVGHSMGGSIATRVAAKRSLPTLAGLVVVDVVEGTAVASLIHMQKILSNRPPWFPSLEKAIEWSVKTGSLRNLDAARVTVPSTLKFDKDNQRYAWLTPLEKSEPYWKGWYQGLSELFLSCPVPKLLLLAGTDRLDRSLTIGQMQGKFQMIVVRHTGHAIQEDVPEEFASLILTFVTRNRIGPRGVEIPLLRRPSA